MDPTQILLIVVVTALTILLIVIGIQVFLILKEFKKTMEKLNKILADAGLISESVAKPIASFSDSIRGISGVTGLLGWLTSKRKKKNQEERESE